GAAAAGALHPEVHDPGARGPDAGGGDHRLQRRPRGRGDGGGVIDHLESVVRRHREIQEEMARPEVVRDPQQLARLGRELRGLDPLVRAYEGYQAAEQQLREARDLLRKESDPEMLDYLRTEEHQAQERLADLE